MSIELTRVDFRLIHGQVITRWLTQCQINDEQYETAMKELGGLE